MKKLFSILIFVIAISCNQSVFSQLPFFPLAESEFQDHYQHLVSGNSDELRYNTFRNYCANRYFSSRQIKKMAQLFAGDYWRYQFAIAAYQQTTDPQNFYEVYDAFASFSTVFRLNDFLKSIPESNYNNLQPVAPVRPQLPLPDCRGYMGRKGCEFPLTDNDFEYYSRNLFFMVNDEQKMHAAADLMNSSCLSMAQFIRLGMALSSEINRIRFMKFHVTRVYDMENYNYGAAAFQSEVYRAEWLNYCRNLFAPPPPPAPAPPPAPPVPRCGVANDEMPELLQTIKKQNFSETMTAMAHQIIVAKKCFTTDQIIQLISVFPFPENKMDIAKFSWDYCVDRSNYYKLVDAFSFSDDKEELMKFINLKK